jgi:drug/metabolite transporter (DMT)-like permease
MKQPKMENLLFFVPIIISIVGSVWYQVAFKSIPAAANPALTLVVVYLVAAVCSLALFIIYPLNTSPIEGLRQFNTYSYLAGLGVVGIELGFLLAFRNGWDISQAALTVNVAAGVVLLPIAFLLFREQITPIRLAGVAVCLVGLWLLVQK